MCCTRVIFKVGGGLLSPLLLLPLLLLLMLLLVLLQRFHGRCRRGVLCCRQDSLSKGLPCLLQLRALPQRGAVQAIVRCKSFTRCCN